jgi:hypothetical protein
MLTRLQHHYSDEHELERVLQAIGFGKLKLRHYEPEGKPGHWHWEVVAQVGKE